MSRMRGPLLGFLLLIPVAALPGEIPPSGTWNGTAPFCEGSCDSYHWVYCRSDGYGSEDDACSATKTAWPGSFGGNNCTAGTKKAFCAAMSDFPQLNDYAGLNSNGQWRGTAPACAGSCESGEVAVCRSTNGKRCDFSPALYADRLEDFGHSCSSGHKVFCVPQAYLEN